MVELGLIPAAGRGVRAYPKTTWIPKPLMTIGGKPLLQHNIELLRDQVGVQEIIVITGYMGEAVRQQIGDGGDLGLKIRYVHCDDPGIGLANGMLLAEEFLQAPFVTVLADELYLGSNHHELKEPEDDYLAVCGILETKDRRLIMKNYSAEMDSAGRIRGLIEKPRTVSSNLLGCGTFLFRPDIFDLIRGAAPSQRSGKVELVEVIDRAARAGRPVYAFPLQGEYVNVNSVEDYNRANYTARSRVFEQVKVSVVIPTYLEEASIAFVVNDFANHPAVDEVLVVDNSSPDRTVPEARDAGARVEVVQTKGYGDTIKWGLDHAQGDLLVVVEADHSFHSKDLGKLLEYLKDADMVIGTRTTREMIEQGTNMLGMVRYANIFVGKLLEVLWWSQQPRFTDVGCTYRALWRSTWDAIRDRVNGTGPEFSPEMMIEVLRARKRIVEIPISYYPRAGGESKHSKSFVHLSRTASRMLRLMFAKRLGRQ